MAITTLLTIGPLHSLLNDVVYALPARAVFVYASGAVEVSEDGSAWTALTGADTVGASTSAVYIRNHTGSTITATCKAISF